jgi:hypothetical protein
MAEWSKAADCKSVREISRWFESNFFHITPKPFLKKIKNTNAILFQNLPRLYTNNKKIVHLNYSYARLRILKWSNFWPSTLKIEDDFSSRTQFYDFARQWTKVAQTYLLLKFFFITNSALSVLKSKKIHQTKSPYNLSLTFKKHQLFLNFWKNKSKKTFLYVSMGLISKTWIENKSFRKNKILKYFMAKQIRRILLLLSVRSINILVKSTPTHLQEFMHYLFLIEKTPLYNPFRQDWIPTYRLRRTAFRISYIYFSSLKPFNTLKTRKRGRIKRKIRRKILKEHLGYVWGENLKMIKR